VHGVVLFGHDKPTRFRFPGRTGCVVIEEVGIGRVVRRIHKVLLLFRKISTEVLDAFGTHPDAAPGDFDVLEDVRLGELVLLALRRFVGVGRNRGIAGFLTRSRVRFTAATSSTFVSSPYCADITSYPAACNGGITLLKHEPSAQIPWQNTMLGFAELLTSRSRPS
jgi:hypothetical protein